MLAFKSFVTLALPLLAVANPLVEVRNDPPTTCNSGDIQCCNSTTTSTSSSTGELVSTLLGLLGLEALAGAIVGLECTPISVVGVGSGNKCTQQTLCCSGNNFGPSGTSSGGTLISLGCSPITLNL
ncbi:hypothetical protein HYPSUDRAFT_35542 [Hypholoma sublateritium FD-334 SS-4]|uniref:Hydrophobin n=1 Tax=Hypholoma sublateritium (strain FD-334 SS-4) TaxID=945553 RepID=A0A0D2Q606_HYPSF|nr:hypothetical protein HYPSUDRAFT_35542 [Hypholoma sublateritium FD-334 SS-4]